MHNMHCISSLPGKKTIWLVVCQWCRLPKTLVFLYLLYHTFLTKDYIIPFGFIRGSFSDVRGSDVRGPFSDVRSSFSDVRDWRFIGTWSIFRRSGFEVQSNRINFRTFEVWTFGVQPRTSEKQKHQKPRMSENKSEPRTSETPNIRNPKHPKPRTSETLNIRNPEDKNPKCQQPRMSVRVFSVVVTQEVMWVSQWVSESVIVSRFDWCDPGEWWYL